MSEWKEWTSGKQPVPDDTRVAIRMRDGDVWKDELAQNLQWEHEDHTGDIVWYLVEACPSCHQPSDEPCPSSCGVDKATIDPFPDVKPRETNWPAPAHRPRWIPFF
jgi:hypothetical protein